MSLQIGAALADGLDRLVSRTGAILTVAYLLVYVVYQTAFNGVLNALYAGMDVEVARVEPALDASPVLDGALVALCMVAMLYLTVVAVRTFVANEQSSFPGPFLTDGVVFAMANLFVGGLVLSVLVWVGSVLLVVPGVFLLVSLVFMTMYVAVEDRNFVAAFKHSWNLAEGNRWSILGLLAVVMVITFVVGFAVGIVGVFATVVAGPAAFSLVMVVLVAPVSMFNLAALAAAFDQLRTDEDDGLGTETTPSDAQPSPA